MTEFKVGDKVRFVKPLHPFGVGDVGKVVTIEPRGMRVEHPTYNPNGHPGWYVYSHEVEQLVEPEPKFKTGDRLRITVEGDFFEETDTWLGLNGVAVLKDTDGVDILNVEKVEPPVEVFKPGDRLRRRTDDGWDLPYEVTLGSDGYLQHLETRVRYSRYDESDNPESFNSGRFEKVNLAEVPF